MIDLGTLRGLFEHEHALATYRQLFTQPANVDIVLRTLLMAVAVTIACGLVAFPVANYMARHAGPRMKAFFYVGVMLPMWTSYLVKVYAWRLILAKEGIVSWFFGVLGLTPVLDTVLSLPVVGGPSLASSYLEHVQPGALPQGAFKEVVSKTKTLDMEMVRKQIAEQDAAAAEEK